MPASVKSALVPKVLEHDPEKWIPVFGQDHAQTFKPLMQISEDEWDAVFRVNARDAFLEARPFADR
jgi:NAD(P)-dependent dehydrogenase (short-subunit alcohol dehydrogenase family)